MRLKRMPKATFEDEPRPERAGPSIASGGRFVFGSGPGFGANAASTGLGMRILTCKASLSLEINKSPVELLHVLFLWD
jgi:hypothetical protein